MTPKQKLLRAVLLINIVALGVGGLAYYRSNLTYGLLAGFIVLLLLPMLFLKTEDEENRDD